MAIPIIMQSRGATSSQQGGFSCVVLPWVLKLLWAPIVDLVYWKKLGRRKSWIVPTQYFLGILTFITSRNIDEWIGDKTKRKAPNVTYLTINFFAINFLSAVQDVAVDGWSLTMLRRENVGHSATCNSLGSALGAFLGYVLFVVLDSKDFCNKWLRSTPQETGILSFSNYLFAWSMAYFALTTFILIFKKDDTGSVIENNEEIKMKLVESYTLMWKILKIKPVQILMILLLTCKIATGPVSSASSLKLVDARYTIVTLALFMAAIIPFKLILPFVTGRLLIGDRSLSSFIGIIPQRIIWGLLYSVTIYFIPKFKKDGDIVWWYSCLIFFGYSTNVLWRFIMSISGQAYFSRVSDPRFGGMYLTLLNALNNFGDAWTGSASLFLMDFLTIQSCTNVNREMKCIQFLNGYYVEVIITGIFGFLWVLWARKKVTKLNSCDESAWLLDLQSKNEIHILPLC